MAELDMALRRRIANAVSDLLATDHGIAKVWGELDLGQVLDVLDTVTEAAQRHYERQPGQEGTIDA